MAIRTFADVPLNPLAAKSEPVKPEPTIKPVISNSGKIPPLAEKPVKDQSLKTDAQSGKRGRPATGTAKEPVTIRLDADLLAAIKATGPGWQTRLNDLIRTHFRPNQF